jgi:hypothetical protein
LEEQPSTADDKPLDLKTLTSARDMPAIDATTFIVECDAVQQSRRTPEQVIQTTGALRRNSI